MLSWGFMERTWLAREKTTRMQGSKREREQQRAQKENNLTLKTMAVVGVVIGWKSTAGEQKLFRFYVVPLKLIKKSKLRKLLV